VRLMATDPQVALKHREYWQCSECALVFVAPQFLLDKAKEKAIYELHENSPEDEGYRHFLRPALAVVKRHLPPRAVGLDFGSGPGPTLSLMLQEAGFACDIFDPFFAPHSEVWQKQYDFITSTEVFEHLERPTEVMGALLNTLKSNGYLIVMTTLWRQQRNFLDWSYKNDPTHIVFYREETFQWLAKHFSLALESIQGNVVVMRKTSES